MLAIITDFQALALCQRKKWVHGIHISFPNQRMFLQTGDSEVYTPPDKAVIASLAFHPTDHVLLIATCNKLYFWSWDQAEPFACVQTASAEEKVRYSFCKILLFSLIETKKSGKSFVF